MSELLSNDDLFSITETVWENMLGLSLHKDSSDVAKIGDNAVTASVQITGEWEGAVVIEVPSTLAVTLACAMFQMDSTEIDDEMTRDAMGEIANMTGGSVKAITPGENTLTLPQVAEGAEGAVSIAKTQILNRSFAICDDEPVIVTVLARKD